ncbi:MAG: PIG-L deacetylase family protein [Planctomycetaceae bacterium]
MKFDFENERVLAVVAHPDDAELLCAGTLIRARADGAEIGICVLCQGDKGQPEPPIPDLVAVRSAEMRAAAELIGAQLIEGGFPDGSLQDSTPSRRTVIELMRNFRPTLVLAHTESDYHPDHRAAAALAAAASWFSASHGHVTDSDPLQSPPALWWIDTVEMVGFDPHCYVDVSDCMELKNRMLACHCSQLARGHDSNFAPLRDMMLRQSRARGAQAGVSAAEAFRIHSVWKRARAW